MNLVATEVTAGALGTHLSQPELEETPEDREPTPGRRRAQVRRRLLEGAQKFADGDRRSNRESAVLEVEKDTHEEALVPKILKKKRKQPKSTQRPVKHLLRVRTTVKKVKSVRGGPWSNSQGRGQRGGAGRISRCSANLWGLSEGARGPDPTEEPGEAGELTESELTGCLWTGHP